jgi:hypothetical protein
MASKVPPLLLEWVAYADGSDPAAMIKSLQHPRMDDVASFSVGGVLSAPPTFAILQAKKESFRPN